MNIIFFHTPMTRATISILVLSFLPHFADGQLRLPRLLGDGMVLQRDAEIKMWGWAGAEEPVSVRFLDRTEKTFANAAGRWEIALARTPPGGPYDMQVSGTDTTITITDIVVGDVWICSGQSNMELTMRRVQPFYGLYVADSRNPLIRQFDVPDAYDFTGPREDVHSGSWVSADPTAVLDFSAVGYFFARELYERDRVPIGLINASLGGSPAQCWMSEEALGSFPEHLEEARRFRDSTLIRRIENEDRSRIREWYDRSSEIDAGYKTSGKPWRDPDVEASAWDVMNVPGYWSDEKLGPVNGVVWFRRTITIPSSLAEKPARIELGRIVDADSVWVNGTFVGTTTYQYPPRRYSVPERILKAGPATIAIRVVNSSGRGGFVEDKPYELTFEEGTRIDLRGEWQYRLGGRMEQLQGETFIRWKPLGLFNAMIAPLTKFSVKGALWYQGESNAGCPLEYRALLPALINDWRAQWRRDDLPFLVVQLPNFLAAKPEPSESNWALIREAQSMALSLPATAMAVTIDVGEWNDIHPWNKKDVGKRLALAALRTAYGDTSVVASGPAFRGARMDGNRVVVSFSNAGSGLTVRGGGKLRQFAVCGADRKFVWANAEIRGNDVIVWSEKVDKPVAVRYAWADNPEGANLFNAEGLPAFPFRTDDFQ